MPVFTGVGVALVTLFDDSGALDARATAELAVLYTQLTNPTSNAIYARIGYEPVLEVLRYQFDVVPG